jgi:hypothetical protein
LGVLGLLALAPAARADLIYDLTQDGCSGGCGPQVSFGQIDLHSVSLTEVQITLTLVNGNEFVKTGNHNALTFNVDGGAATVTPLTTGFAVSSSTTNPSFGTFGYGITCSGCGRGASNPLPGPLMVDVSRISGLTPSDFIANSDGFFFAADILSGTTGNTGAIAAIASPVPEPSFYGALAFGLIGALIVLKRERRTRSQE